MDDLDLTLDWHIHSVVEQSLTLALYVHGCFPFGFICISTRMIASFEIHMTIQTAATFILWCISARVVSSKILLIVHFILDWKGIWQTVIETALWHNWSTPQSLMLDNVVGMQRSRSTWLRIKPAVHLLQRWVHVISEVLSFIQVTPGPYVEL